MCVGFTVNLKLEQEQRSIPGKKKNWFQFSETATIKVVNPTQMQ
jgi:hypothetical protein